MLQAVPDPATVMMRFFFFIFSAAILLGQHLALPWLAAQTVALGQRTSVVIVTFSVGQRFCDDSVKRHHGGGTDGRLPGAHIAQLADELANFAAGTL